MRKFFYVLALLFSFSDVFSQYKVRFVVKDNSGSPQDSLFIAGTFNNWDPGAGVQNKLKPEGPQTHSITLILRRELPNINIPGEAGPTWSSMRTEPILITGLFPYTRTR